MKDWLRVVVGVVAPGVLPVTSHQVVRCNRIVA